jgi:hypothetical protein
MDGKDGPGQDDVVAEEIDENAEVRGIDLLNPDHVGYGDVVEICVRPRRSEDEVIFYVAIAGILHEAGSNGRSLVTGLVVRTEHEHARGLPAPFLCGFNRFVSVNRMLHYGDASNPQQMGTVTRFRVIRRPQDR